MIARDAAILKSDLDALAVLANEKLLPLVNAAIAAGIYGFPGGNAVIYDHPDLAAPNLFVAPQPDYSFNEIPAAPPVNLIPGDATYDASGKYILAMDKNSWFDYSPGANEIRVDSNSELRPSQLYDKGICPSAEGTQFVFLGAPNAPVTAFFSVNTENWIREINRIRGDLFNLILTPGLTTENPQSFIDPGSLLSGPWIVGINDPDTYPMAASGSVNSLYWRQGILWGTFVIPVIPLDSNPLIEPLFKSVNFIYALNDAPDGVTIQTTRSTYSLISNSFSFTAELAGTLYAELRFPFSGPAGAPPDVSTFDIADTSSVAVTWSTVAADGAGNFYLLGIINAAIAAGTGTIHFTSTPPTGYAYTGSPFSQSKLIFSESSAVQIVQGIHSTSKLRGVAADDLPANSDFTFAGQIGRAAWIISAPDLKGVWRAMTLPAPALNVFLDNDLPPFIGAIGPLNSQDYGNMAHAENLFGAGDWIGNYSIDNPPANQPDNSQPVFAGSMRENAVWPILKNGRPVMKDGLPRANLLRQSAQSQPSQWPVNRDTDFVPFDLGFNTGDQIEISSNQILAPNGVETFSIAVPDGYLTNWFSVKIRLLARGTALKGWKNGQLQSGEPLGKNLKIFVSTGMASPAHFDFFTENNEVNIPNDGGAGYPALINNGGFTFAVQNPFAETISFDVMVEIDFAAIPQRNFFPAPGTFESFSHACDGTPFFNPDIQPAPDWSKTIPQSGHCIYKIRATRPRIKNSAGLSEIPNSGEALTITFGQNRLQPDGSLEFFPLLADDNVTPFTLTIPADDGDTGDVTVFWPVLAGNELTWKCSNYVVIDAWVNWQPMFHFSFFGRQPLDSLSHVDSINHFTDYFWNATFWQYCLEFKNFFSLEYANYPPAKIIPNDSNSYIQTRTAFPLSVEIFNDLLAGLNLIS